MRQTTLLPALVLICFLPFLGCSRNGKSTTTTTGNAGPAVDTAPTAQKDLEKIQGEWKVEKSVWHGEEEPDDLRLKRAVWFDGSTMTLRAGGKVLKSEVTLDPNKKPAAIDIKPEREKPMLGIYKIDGDTLSICWNELGRPGGFEVNKGDNDPGLVLFVLKRKK